jgi:uncharacterized membrane protein YvbJ
MLGVISGIFGIVIIIVVVILIFKLDNSNHYKVDNFLKLLKERDIERWRSLGEPRINAIMPTTIITNKVPFLSNFWIYFKYAKFGDFSDQDLANALNEVRDTFSIKLFDVIATTVVFLIFIGVLIYATLY